MSGGGEAEDWARYWRSPELPLEAMHAHFARHVYHRHSHDTYSFGVTESGAQTFTCRGARHVSSQGMVMAFNPDDPHDGHAADRSSGFTYRMIHLGPELVADMLADAAERPVGLPLFAAPVSGHPALTPILRALGTALVDGGATALRRDELLGRAVHALVRYGAHGLAPAVPALTTPDAVRVATRARTVLEEAAGEVAAAELAAATGRSRFAVYRSFQAVYGLAPSDYQRQLRLRTARQLLGAGRGAAEVAALTGFADQSHLTRWFVRYYGVTPGAYRRANRP
ncbi:MAG: AraC family transcriptional regulator [Mycobacteriales bacterium]